MSYCQHCQIAAPVWGEWCRLCAVSSRLCGFIERACKAALNTLPSLLLVVVDDR